MRKLIIVILTFTSSVNLTAQFTDSVLQINKRDYLDRFKWQRTTGYVLFIGGAITTGIGLLTSFKEGFDVTPSESDSKNGEDITIAGAALMASSIPFFIGYTSAKRKAMSLSVKTEKALLLSNTGFSYIHIPSLNLKIRL